MFYTSRYGAIRQNSLSQDAYAGVQELCKKTFIGSKYGEQLKAKGDCIISTIDDYYIQITENNMLANPDDFFFNSDMKLYVESPDLVQEFLKMKSPIYYSTSIQVTTFLSRLLAIKKEIQELQNEYIYWLSNKFQLTDRNNPAQIDLTKFLEYNTEETGKLCEQKAEDVRRRMVKAANIDNLTQRSSKNMPLPFETYSKHYDDIFGSIDLKEQNAILTRFQSLILTLDKSVSTALNYGYQQHRNVFQFNNTPYMINESHSSYSFHFVPEYLLKFLIEHEVHGKIFEIMINEKIKFLNSLGQLKILAALQKYARPQQRQQIFQQAQF